MSNIIIKNSCKYYTGGFCNKLPKRCFGLLKQRCVEVSFMKCDIAEKPTRPHSPPPSPH